MKKIALITALTAVTMSSCVTRITDFTVLSTKNVNLNKMGQYKKGPRVTGEDKKMIICVIPTGTPDVKEAIDNAIEAHPKGVALTNGVVHSKSFYIPYIYGEFSYVVEGDVLLER